MRYKRNESGHMNSHPLHILYFNNLCIQILTFGIFKDHILNYLDLYTIKGVFSCDTTYPSK